MAITWRLALTLFLAGCVDPAAQQAGREREDAQLRVLADVVFYWRCQHQAVVRAGECDHWSAAFERDRTTFVAK